MSSESFSEPERLSAQFNNSVLFCVFCDAKRLHGVTMVLIEYSQWLYFIQMRASFSLIHIRNDEHILVYV